MKTFTLSAVFKNAFSLFGKHKKNIFLIAVAYTLVAFGLKTLEASLVFANTITSYVLSAISIAVQLLGVFVLYRASLHNEDLISSFKNVCVSWKKILALIAIGLYFISPMFLFATITLVPNNISWLYGVTAVSIMLAFWGLINGLKYSLSLPIYIAEDIPVLDAFVKSRFYTSGKLLKVFWYSLLMAVLTYLPVLVIVFGMILAIIFGAFISGVEPVWVPIFIMIFMTLVAIVLSLNIFLNISLYKAIAKEELETKLQDELEKSRESFRTDLMINFIVILGVILLYYAHLSRLRS